MTNCSRRKRPSPSIRLGWLSALVVSGNALAADQEIHRCPQPDGTVAFQETPCPETTDETAAADDPVRDSTPAASDDFFDFVNPFDNPELSEPAQEPEPQTAPSQNRADCEKSTRDAIDAIDLEMRKGYSEQQGRQYLAELLELTRQLRACKAL